MKLSIVTLGENAQAVLGHHPYNVNEVNKETFILIVTDDATTYQNAIGNILSNENIHGRPTYLVIDMNTFSDYAQFKGAWTYYNKIENTQTIKGIVDLIQYHLIQPSLIAFDSRDLLGICSIGEYLRSIRTDKGIEELKAVNMRSEERRVGKECRSRWSPYH